MIQVDSFILITFAISMILMHLLHIKQLNILRNLLVESDKYLTEVYKDVRSSYVSKHIILSSNKDVFTYDELMEVFKFSDDVASGKAIYNFHTRVMDSNFEPSYYRSPNDRAV